MRLSSRRCKALRVDIGERVTPSLRGPFAVCVVLTSVIMAGAVILEKGRQGMPPVPAYPVQGPSGRPLLGANYTHVSFAGCSWENNGILAARNSAALHQQLDRQLTAMRREGVETIRTIVWHTTAPGGTTWGVIPSAGGRLSEPYRHNLAALAAETRRLGFRRLTVAMGPQSTNSPLAQNYDSRKLEENWRFLSDVRSIIKRYGPPDTRLDILNEAAPSDYMPGWQVQNLKTYITTMYQEYTSRFGTGDVTVSAIGPETERDHGNRLQNLIDILGSSPLGYPRWFEIHLNFGAAGAEHGLRDSLEVLARRGLVQPVVIGELPYNDSRVSAALEETVRLSGRVDEVTEWHRTPDDVRCDVSPPYAVDAYRWLQQDRDPPAARPQSVSGREIAF